jgi:hypothetical protein
MTGYTQDTFRKSKASVEGQGSNYSHSSTFYAHSQQEGRKHEELQLRGNTWKHQEEKHVGNPFQKRNLTNYQLSENYRGNGIKSIFDTSILTKTDRPTSAPATRGKKQYEHTNDTSLPSRRSEIAYALGKPDDRVVTPASPSRSRQGQSIDSNSCKSFCPTSPFAIDSSSIVVSSPRSSKRSQSAALEHFNQMPEPVYCPEPRNTKLCSGFGKSHVNGSTHKSSVEYNVLTNAPLQEVINPNEKVNRKLGMDDLQTNEDSNSSSVPSAGLIKRDKLFTRKKKSQYSTNDTKSVSKFVDAHMTFVPITVPAPSADSSQSITGKTTKPRTYPNYTSASDFATQFLQLRPLADTKPVPRDAAFSFDQPSVKNTNNHQSQVSKAMSMQENVLLARSSAPPSSRAAGLTSAMSLVLNHDLSSETFQGKEKKTDKNNTNNSNSSANSSGKSQNQEHKLNSITSILDHSTQLPEATDKRKNVQSDIYIKQNTSHIFDAPDTSSTTIQPSSKGNNNAKYSGNQTPKYTPLHAPMTKLKIDI